MWHHNIACYVWISYISTTASKGGCLLAWLGLSLHKHHQTWKQPPTHATSHTAQSAATNYRNTWSYMQKRGICLNYGSYSRDEFGKIWKKIKLFVIIYANFQNPLCHFVDPCTHTIRTKFHQNPEKNEREIFFYKIWKIHIISIIYANIKNQ